VTEPRSYHETGDDTGTPRWVKVFGTVILVVVVLFLILMFTRGPGGRRHGPGLHTPSADTRGQTLPAGGRR
jgi:hypothetical protein